MPEPIETPTPQPRIADATEVTTLFLLAGEAENGPWQYNNELGEVEREDYEHFEQIANVFHTPTGVFIAACRQAVPVLCASHEALRTQLAAAQEAQRWIDIVPSDPATNPAIPQGDFQESDVVMAEMKDGERRRAQYVRLDQSSGLIWFTVAKGQKIYPVRWHPIDAAPATAQPGEEVTPQ